MRILLFSKPDSIWTKEYIVNVLKKQECQVFMVIDDNCCLEDIAYYEQLGVSLVNIHNSSGIFYRIPKIKTVVGLIRCLIGLTENNKFDIIEFQGAPLGLLQAWLYSFVCGFGKIRICNYWGSDILRINERTARNIKGFLKKLTYVVLATKDMQNQFHKYYGNKYKDKERCLLLGTSIFDNIDNVKKEMDKKACKRYFNIDPDLMTFAVGYNGSKSQQHREILNALANLPDVYKNRVCIILHIGYGIDNSTYLDELKSIIEDNFNHYIIINKFLDKEKTAILRCSTDFMIHGQISDGFSASIRELLYAGGKLINAAWIDYDEYDQIGIKYYKFDNWDKLDSVVMKALDNNCDINNTKVLYDNFSWNAVEHGWRKLHNQ